jgi:hypothetical protein
MALDERGARIDDIHELRAQAETVVRVDAAEPVVPVEILEADRVREPVAASHGGFQKPAGCGVDREDATVATGQQRTVGQRVEGVLDVSRRPCYLSHNACHAIA